MGILNKNKGEQADASLLENANTLLAEANVTIGELQAKVDAFELEGKVTKVASKIGFTGNVSELIKEDSTYETVMDSMLEAVETQTEEEVETFQETASAELGEGGEDEFVAKTQSEALDHVKKEFSLVGEEAVDKAHELYPDIFA